jgi:hypothetical protein
LSQVHGSKATLKLGSSATPAVLQDVSGYAATLGAAFSRDSAETTTMASGSKKHIPGLKDATLPMDGPFDTAADPIMWDLYNTGAVVNFEYTPAGSGVVGTPKYTGVCFITAYNVSNPVGGAGTMSGTFQVSGDVTRTVQ